MSVFDWPAEPFLLLYAALLAGSIGAGLAIPRWLRPEGRAEPDVGEEGLAMLAGGHARFTDALVARLLARRELTVEGRDLLAIRERGGGRTDAERAVLRGIGPYELRQVDLVLRPYAAAEERRVVAGGAMLDRHTALWMRAWQSAPYLLLLGFGLARLELGLERDRPVGFLGLLLLATLVLGAARFAAVDRRTAAGRDALGRARARADRLRRAPTLDEAGLAVALFGTSVLAGSSLGALHEMRRADGAGDGNGAGGGDTDGGCGGGCGGCGS